MKVFGFTVCRSSAKLRGSMQCSIPRGMVAALVGAASSQTPFAFVLSSSLGAFEELSENTSVLRRESAASASPSSSFTFVVNLEALSRSSKEYFDKHSSNTQFYSVEFLKFQVRLVNYCLSNLGIYCTLLIL